MTEVSNIRVQSTNCIYFRFADLTLTPGPHGEDDNDLYRPQIVEIPRWAKTLKVLPSATDLWKQVDSVYPEFLVNCNGRDYRAWTDANYESLTYNSHRIPRNKWRLGRLEAIMTSDDPQDGVFSTGDQRTHRFYAGVEESFDLTVPPYSDERCRYICFGAHDIRDWTDNSGYIGVRITFDGEGGSSSYSESSESSDYSSEESPELSPLVNIDRGLILIGVDGAQKATENLDAYSAIIENTYVDSLSDKFSMDSAWETADFYYCNNSTGEVVKKAYIGPTTKATLQLSHPSSLSVIQRQPYMLKNVAYPILEDRGVWIADEGLDEVIKTDQNLDVTARSPYIADPYMVVSNIDRGCFVVSLDRDTLFQLDANGEVLAVVTTDNFSPAASSLLDMKVDAFGYLWILSSDYMLYKIDPSNLDFEQVLALDPLSRFATKPPANIVRGIDIDRWATYQDVYVVGGGTANSWVQRYTTDGHLIGERTGLEVPGAIQIAAVQANGSHCFYVLGVGSSVKVIQCNKDTLAMSSSIDMTLPSVKGMLISHYACSVKSSGVTIPFLITGSAKHISRVTSVDHDVVLTELVDLTATGPSTRTVQERGSDLGKYEYTDDVPSRPLELPPGFAEVYRSPDQ